MPLPYSFLLGLFGLFASWDGLPDLPREVEQGPFFLYLPLVLVPWLIVHIVAARVRRRGRRLAALAQLLVVPAAYITILTVGQLSVLADHWSGGVLVLATSIKLAPLLAMEFGVNLAHRQIARSIAPPLGPAPFHLTLVVFLTILVFVFTGLLDLLMIHRGVHVFVASTAIGNTLWVLFFLLVLCALLPLVFRVVVSSSDRVPEDARLTARALGFPGDDVHLLRTNNRLINAMLVGPLPRFRYLFLTDGLVSLLDPLSLRGVVAHEVGHAKLHHPMLLLVGFGLIPMLLFHPLDVLGLGELGVVASSILLVVVLIAGIRLVRRVAHQFELEADLKSADALGGSAPCILALHKVGELSGGLPDRDSLRHPSEEKRIHHLLSCEGDPWFRERFERRGLALRRAIGALLVVAVLLSAWAHVRSWPVDKLLMQFFTGRFVAAAKTLEEMPANLPPGRGVLVEEMRDELRVARTLHPDGGDWMKIRDDLSARALVRGREELARNGPAVARPWFAIGMAKPHPTPLELSLFLYCQAVSREDRERSGELRAHMLAVFELDAELRQALSVE